MEESKGRKSFWTSLTGILTALAALITAAGGIAALVATGGGGGGGGNQSSAGSAPAAQTTTAQVSLTDWAQQANEICQSAYDDIRTLGLGQDPDAQFRAIPQTTQIATRANAKLQALDRPPANDARITQLLAAASQANVAARNAYEAWKVGDRATADAQLAQARTSTQELQRIDGELGANVCAQGP